MSMHQVLSDFVQNLDQSDVGINELFNLDMIAAKRSLFVYSPRLDSEQMDVILEHLKAGVSVTLLTTKRMNSELKVTMKEEFFSEEIEKNPTLSKMELIGKIIIAIGFLILGFSYVMQWFGSPINPTNEVYRLILPLVEIYLGFVIADTAFKRQYARNGLSPLLKVEVFRNSMGLPHCYLYMTDDKRVIYQKIDKDKMGISHVKIIENPVVVDQLSNLINKHTPLSKYEGMTLTKLRQWLLD